MKNEEHEILYSCIKYSDKKVLDNRIFFISNLKNNKYLNKMALCLLCEDKLLLGGNFNVYLNMVKRHLPSGRCFFEFEYKLYLYFKNILYSLLVFTYQNDIIMAYICQIS